MKSIIVEKMDRCCICGSKNVQMHHVFYGNANRKLADEDGLVVPLCLRHHLDSSEGVHFNRQIDTMLKMEGQRAWEREHPEGDFIKRYGKNYK